MDEEKDMTKPSEVLPPKNVDKRSGHNASHPDSVATEREEDSSRVSRS